VELLKEESILAVHVREVITKARLGSPVRSAGNVISRTTLIPDAEEAVIRPVDVMPRLKLIRSASAVSERERAVVSKTNVTFDIDVIVVAATGGWINIQARIVVRTHRRVGQWDEIQIQLVRGSHLERFIAQSGGHQRLLHECESALP